MSDSINDLKLDPASINAGALSSEKLSKLKSLRLPQDFEALAKVTKVITTIAIGKPHRQLFFRIHPEWREYFPILEIKNPTEFYVADTDAVPGLADEVTVRLLVPGITRDGSIFVWPLRVATSEKPLDSWSRSALTAMQVAKTSWVRLLPSMKTGGYDTFSPRAPLPDPEWPDTTCIELIESAFDGRVIDTPDHPVVKALNGEL